ncbi:Lrp/AsnC family leucine-responsive transcriptional regulator [Thermosporothrix hazakensis]|uniref:Lrp/AsnC family leucine-responsive transcriptional regulator n=2 Tax=Thermosporothrix TaxID=768650 RepID=A0A326U574_THEHA|nr:Lrp/AsnC family transcriptional regulator [Thermosporothrix hazakensis]PZW26658.1 Lrp/AsnC family leucine-responsive transcriptional regulator [Thermosporothrix hazakensis]BBH89456.1 AsnC family transcriptional regulator [Thermosporothrix sp. COM3]GCE47640.1 AsnC family transcriptional regulator [Thermosporothrix hazakensis]
MDEIDQKILNLLARDGRMTHTALGKATGLSAPAVYARIQRLEQEGVITGYTVLLDPTKIGCGLTAIVRVVLQACEGENELFEDFVRREPQIVECYDVDGEDCFILKIRTASPQSLRELVARIRSIPQVTRTITSIALLTIKEPGVNGPLPEY